MRSLFQLFLIITLTIHFLLLSKATANSPDLSPVTIKGYTYDIFADQPLEFATVTLKNSSDSSLVTGAITDINGFFRLTNIAYGNYYLEASFMGYDTRLIAGIELSEQDRNRDLGRIEMQPTEEFLQEVVITADRPTMSYQIDRRVINVSQSHTSASGTAIEVLENIPSVTVSIDGEVSLRGSSSFTVLIDGKPSILDASDILNQIPASQIETIEIITNPSARFDPDGVAGIINIVMKQNRYQGITGIANLNAGSQNNIGGDFLVNFRRDRLNFYLGADYNERGNVGYSVRRTESFASDTTFLLSTGEFERLRDSWGVRGGIDFNINPVNTLSFAVRLGDSQRGGLSERVFEEWTSGNPLRYTYSSFEDQVRSGYSYTLTMDYKKDFDRKGHNILAQVVFSQRESQENSLNQLLAADGTIMDAQRGIEWGPRSRANLRLDYTLPFAEKQRFEAGYQTRISLSEEVNDFYTYNNLTTIFELDDLFSKKVDYDTRIHSAYSTLSGEFNKLGYQAGLRTEYTDRLIAMAGQENDYTLNRWDFYPTLHFSYQMPYEQQLMTSYTRRLQRTRGWYLEPFYTWRNAYSIRIGNPDLIPEYIDSYELNYMKAFEKNMFSLNVYYRITNNKIEWVRGIYDDQPGVILTTFENVGKDYSLGTEMMMGFDPFSWWHFDVLANIYDYRQRGELYGRDYSSESFNWNARLNNDFRITPSTRVQLRGMYNSPRVTARSERSGYFVTNLAVRQDFLNRDLSVTLQIRDIFGTTKRESTNWGDGFTSYNNWEPQTPIFSVRISYRLNNYRADRRVTRGGDSSDDTDGMDEL